MHSLVRHSSLAMLALLLASGALARGGQPLVPKESIEPAPLANDWQFDLALPGWLANTSGTIGLDGFNSGIYLGVDTLLKNLDMIATFSGEVRKGRFGVYGDMLYVDASDSAEPGGLIEKATVQLSQWLVDLELNYRVLEGPKGFVDVRVGVRYNNIYNSVTLAPDDDAIDRASVNVVDNLADRLRNRLRDELSNIDLRGFPVTPLGGREPGRIGEIVRDILKDRLSELRAAIQARDAAATQALREDAQRRVDAVKRKISDRIASRLKDQLDSTASLDEDWWDPYVGIRFRYNLTKALYLTGKADIGGFGISSQITWQGYAALGCQITRHIYAEAGYRYLYTDYDQNNFVYKVTQSGVQLTAGVVF